MKSDSQRYNFGGKKKPKPVNHQERIAKSKRKEVVELFQFHPLFLWKSYFHLKKADLISETEGQPGDT